MVSARNEDTLCPPDPMTSETGTPPPRFGIAPMTLMTAAVAVGLAVVTTITVLALQQPWLGLKFSNSSDGGLIALERGGNMKVEGILVLSNESQTVELEPLDLAMEPDGAMGTYEVYRRFLDRQDTLARIQRSAKVEVTSRDGERIAVTPLLKGRPISSLPVDFWVQISVGLLAWFVSAGVFAFRPRETSARYLLLSGAATLIFAPAAALYTTRELALPANLFRWANDLNFLGGSLFAASLVSLLLYYPRKIAPRWVGMTVVLIYIAWWVAQQMGFFESMTQARRVLVMIGMLATFALSGAQWFLTRRDPVARAALQWFLLSWVMCSGVFGVFILLPQLFGIDTSPLQGYGFLLFLLVYVGLAFGILRYRLFQLGSWWRRVIFWLAGVLLLVLFDLVFLFGLRLSSATALSLSLLACGMIWLPLRSWVWRKFGGRGFIAREDLFSRVVDVALTPPGSMDKSTRWHELLISVFDPISSRLPENGPDRVSVGNDGSVMVVPAVHGMPALQLNHAHGGRRLFRHGDATTAEEMISMLGHANASRSAFEGGVTKERGRIARDVHDSIGAHLLAALHSPTAEEKDERIRDAVSDLRDFINNSRRSEVSFDEALARLRLETAERLERAGIQMKWSSYSAEFPATGLTWIPELRAIVREAVSNVIRHSSASTVTVSIQNRDGMLVLEIADDGRGFDPESMPTGHGLANMRSRVQALGGSLRLDPSPCGTTMVAEFSIHKNPS